MRELGYIEGKNIAIETRYTQGVEGDVLTGLATGMVGLKVDVIVTAGTPAARAAKKATTTIPIVMATSGDPRGTGLVSSLARPEGNLTGLSLMTPDVAGKRLQLLKEAFPKISRVAVLWDAANASHVLQFREVELAARSLGVRLQSVTLKGPKAFDDAFNEMVKGRAEALMVFMNALTWEERRLIADLAARRRLPAIYEQREPVEAGGLMGYGVFVPDMFRRAATYVDKILRGAKPGDLPVEQPTKFELLINLRTAKALGLTIPQSLLIRADEVIR